MTAKWSRWRYLEARFVTILTIRFKGALVPAWPADRSPTRTGPVEADGAVDAQNAPTAPWKTLLVFHELPQGFPHPITHDKPRKSPESYWETRIDPGILPLLAVMEAGSTQRTWPSQAPPRPAVCPARGGPYEAWREVRSARPYRLDPRTGEQKDFIFPDGARNGTHEVIVDRAGIVWAPEHSGSQPGIPKRLLGLNPETEQWEYKIPLDPNDIIRMPIKWAQSFAIDSQQCLRWLDYGRRVEQV